MLKADRRVRLAAMVARQFRLDPVALLDDNGDDFLMLVRVAAVEIVQEAEKRAAEKNRMTGAARRPRRR